MLQLESSPVGGSASQSAAQPVDVTPEQLDGSNTRNYQRIDKQREQWTWNMALIQSRYRWTNWPHQIFLLAHPDLIIHKFRFNTDQRTYRCDTVSSNVHVWHARSHVIYAFVFHKSNMNWIWTEQEFCYINFSINGNVSANMKQAREWDIYLMLFTQIWKQYEREREIITWFWILICWNNTLQ